MKTTPKYGTPQIPTTRLPHTWRLQYLLQQTGILILAGLAAVLLAQSSPVYQGIFRPLGVLETPWGFHLAPIQIIPLITPVLLGIPLVLNRHRAPLLLWVALMTLAAVFGVIEVARLNWAAFAGGFAFRVETGPVPLMRTLAGLLLILCGVLLLAQQATHQHLRILAERGVTRRQLAHLRTNMLRWERLVTLAAGLGGTVLLLVTAISMHLSERPPGDSPWLVPAILWTLLLLGLTAGVIAHLTRRHKEPPAPPRHPSRET
jgi:hypothetical protein